MNQSPPRKLKFIHITKNAGTSIENIAQEAKINWGRFDEDLKFLSKTFWHQPFTFDNHPLKQRKIIENNDLFAVVRNPYTRCISEYYCKWGGPKNVNGTREQLNNYLQNKLTKIHTLQKKYAVLLQNQTESGKFFNKYEEIWHRASYGHFFPQYAYIYRENGTQYVKNVIKFENLQQEFNSLMQKYNLKMRLNRHDNKSRSNKLTVNDLAPKTKELIYQVYKKDFELFGYNK